MPCHIYALLTAAETVQVAVTPAAPRNESVLRSGSHTVGIMNSAASSMYMLGEDAREVAPKSLKRLSPCM